VEFLILAFVGLLFFGGFLGFARLISHSSQESYKNKERNKRSLHNQTKQQNINTVESQLFTRGIKITKRLDIFSFFFRGEDCKITTNLFIGIATESKEIVFIQLNNDDTISNVYIYRWQDIVSFNFNINDRDFGNLKTASDVTGILAGGAVGYLGSQLFGALVSHSVGGKRYEILSCSLTLHVNNLQNPVVNFEFIPKGGMSFYVDGKYKDFEMFSNYLENIAGTLNYIINNS
jgi:hypothetical protein